MAGSDSSLKTSSGSVNVVVSDSESEYKDEIKSKRSTKRRVRATRRPSVSQHHHIKHYVEHNYHDHKHDPVELPVTNDKEVPKRSGHKGGVSTPFPDKLHDLLENVENHGKDDVIGWMPHGRAFVVHKPKEFVSDIMPQFFKQSKLTSFQRQLNLYGFSRLTTGPDRGGYYHELFIRGRSDLCARMVRTRVKGNGSKAASSPSTEPNFYNMEPCLASDSPKVAIAPPPMHAIPSAENDVKLFQEEDLEEDLARVETPEPFPNGPGTSEEEDPIVPFSKTAVFWEDDNEGDLGIIDLATAPQEEAMFSSLPPVVTPVTSESRKLLQNSDRMPPMLPMVASLDSLEMAKNSTGIHSGDQVFFEGLPFHYLELKDIEDSLVHHGEVHCV